MEKYLRFLNNTYFYDREHLAAMLFAKLFSPENSVLCRLLNVCTYEDVFKILCEISGNPVIFREGKNTIFKDPYNRDFTYRGVLGSDKLCEAKKSCGTKNSCGTDGDPAESGKFRTMKKALVIGAGDPADSGFASENKPYSSSEIIRCDDKEAKAESRCKDSAGNNSIAINDLLKIIKSNKTFAKRINRLATLFKNKLEKSDLDAYLKRLEETKEYDVLIPGDDDWPVGFYDLEDRSPYCLWVRTGERKFGAFLKRTSIGIVGSRSVTDYGYEVAYDLARDLSCLGYTIVSGGAIGIDKAAHLGALRNGTVSFFAGGVNCMYPATNEPLFGSILSNGGAIVSEIPVDICPMRFRFLNRNRLIAAFSKTVIVAEATWRSGAISTANNAIELNRIVLAVPGSIKTPYSSGCHRLIKENKAQLITNVQDVVDMTEDGFSSFGFGGDRKVEQVFEPDNNISQPFTRDKNSLQVFPDAKNNPKAFARDKNNYAIDNFDEVPEVLKIKHDLDLINDKLYPLGDEAILLYESMYKRFQSIDEIKNKIDFSVVKIMTLLYKLESAGLVKEKDGRWAKVHRY